MVSINKLKHLEKARKIAQQKVKCNFCNKEFSKTGIKKHTDKCKNGKDCPICGQWTQKDKTTCSYSCANTYFRSKTNHPNWKESQYKSTCFHYHNKECVVCKESNIVEVHHLNENRNDNGPENLIPLCPTHHSYWYSRYKHLIEKIVYDYVKKWKNT